MSAKALPPAELCATGSLGTLRVRFFQTGDRYGHAIDLVDGDTTRTLLESVEGGETDLWPLSPAMQHLNVSWIESEAEHRHVAMLVGGAGSSHWSMCVAVSDRASLTRGNTVIQDAALMFELACRVQKPPLWLGSTYRILAAPAAVSEELNCASIPIAPPHCLVETQGIKLQMDTVSAPLPLLRCRAADADAKDFDLPMTIRWRYSLRLIGSRLDDD